MINKSLADMRTDIKNVMKKSFAIKDKSNADISKQISVIDEKILENKKLLENKISKKKNLKNDTTSSGKITLSNIETEINKLKNEIKEMKNEKIKLEKSYNAYLPILYDKDVFSMCRNVYNEDEYFDRFYDFKNDDSLSGKILEIMKDNYQVDLSLLNFCVFNVINLTGNGKINNPPLGFPYITVFKKHLYKSFIPYI
jgi:hypothetical protein